MKTLYLGTPECSAYCLEFLLKKGVDIVGVVTQPDRPFGRKLTLKAPPVKEIALKHKLRLFQPERASDPEVIADLSILEPDVTVVFAFGEFLSDPFLKIPGISTVNLHLSLLPKYRGAAPVQWAIIDGKKVTGVTTFHIVKAMDAGDIIYQREVPIAEDDTGETLTRKLTEAGSEVMLKTIRDLYDRTAPRTQQDHSKATLARKLKKSDGLIDWNSDSDRIHDLIRGMNPWPCAYSVWRSGDEQRILKFFSVQPSNIKGDQPGRVLAEGDDLFVATGNGAVQVLSVQIEGKRIISGREFLNGHRAIRGALLG